MTDTVRCVLDSAEAISCTLEIIKEGQWVSPLAILISAIIAGGLAWWSIRTNREIARKRATLDVILKSESDGYFERIYTVFVSEKKRKAGLVALLDADTDGERRSKLEVDNFLNHYELIAISIKKKILDEDFYKEWMRSTYIKHFNESREYIYGIRKANEMAYVCFEELAVKWSKEGAKKNSSC